MVLSKASQTGSNGQYRRSQIPDPVREQIRFEAIENWLAGMTPTRLAHKYGTSRKIVYQWIDRYKTGGWEGLKHVQEKRDPNQSYLLNSKSGSEYCLEPMGNSG